MTFDVLQILGTRYLIDSYPVASYKKSHVGDMLQGDVETFHGIVELEILLDEELKGGYHVPGSPRE